MIKGWEKWEGQVVGGRFPLRQYLGGSQNSAVFLTEVGDQRPRKAAIKLIPANVETARTQLSRWELAAKLSHPHLVGLSEMGQCQIGDAKLLFVVMEYAEENLAQILPQRALTTDEARDMLQPLLEVLAYIHAEGLVHGHLKPSNIMAVNDRLKVSSDGICPAGGTSRDRREKNVYDSPESASEGKAPAADIWSLGVLLVDVLTQRPPTLQETGEPVLLGALPEPFMEIARHSLVRDPQRRWTAGAIAAWLRSATAVPETREPEKPASFSPHARLGKARYKILAAAVGIVALVILGGKTFKQPAQTPATPSVAVETSQLPAAPQAVRAPAKGRATGSVVEQALPTVSKSARDTIQGRIKISVRVEVDGSGNVVGAKLVSAGPSQYFAKLTLDAARRWKFKAAEMNGQSVPSEWLLRFELTRKGTTVNPTPTTR